MNQTEKKLKFGDREFFLLGTAHISKESCEQVSNVVKEYNPECVAIELDEQRYKALNDAENWKNLDIIKVLKNNQGFLLLANLVLSGFQRRMGNNVGIKPGDEMRAADATAKELNIPTSLVDRPIQVTLRRAWGINSLWGKCKLLSALIASAFDKEEVSSEQIENLKKQSEMDGMMKELADYMPNVKKVLIDERDRYLASHIWESKGNKILAVLGAGHLSGVEKYLNELSAGTISSDTTDISDVPPKKIVSKIMGWVIPSIIVAIMVCGFIFGGVDAGKNFVGTWLVCNALLAGLGSLLAGGHIVTVIVSAIAAPFTSLSPLVGVGLFSGLTQAVVCKPKVSDMETLQDDVTKVKGFYKNRILKVLLVFFFSSLGSSIGTFVAGANFIKKIAEFFM